MREILFRGRRTDNGEWVYGDLIHRKIWGHEVTIIRVSDSGFDCYEEYEVIPETVGQYIGCTDKNRTKIFEGDIVRSTIERGEGCQSTRTENGVIGYDGIGMLGLILYKDKNGENVWSDFFNELSLSGTIDDYYFEIIGNIYDNF